MNSKIIKWLKGFCIWPKDGRLLWVTLVVLAVALLLGFYPPITESRLRIAGLFLQICGLITVAKGISDTRKLFGHLWVWRVLWQWLKHFSRFRPKVTGIAASVLESATAFGRVTGWISAATTAKHTAHHGMAFSLRK